MILDVTLSNMKLSISYAIGYNWFAGEKCPHQHDRQQKGRVILGKFLEVFLMAINSLPYTRVSHAEPGIELGDALYGLTS